MLDIQTQVQAWSKRYGVGGVAGHSRWYNRQCCGDLWTVDKPNTMRYLWITCRLETDWLPLQRPIRWSIKIASNKSREQEPPSTQTLIRQRGVWRKLGKYRKGNKCKYLTENNWSRNKIYIFLIHWKRRRFQNLLYEEEKLVSIWPWSHYSLWSIEIFLKQWLGGRSHCCGCRFHKFSDLPNCYSLSASSSALLE